MDASPRMHHHPPGRPKAPDREAVDGGALGSTPETDGDLDAIPLTTRDRTTVAVIEDNRLIREALTALLNRSPDLRVIGGRPEGFRSILEEQDPGVVLLNPGFENGDTLRLATQILTGFPDTRVIVMDLFPAYEELWAFMTAGVSGFVLKDASLEDVVGTIRAVEAGLKVLPDRMIATLFCDSPGETVANHGRVVPDSVRLTPREGEVADHIAEGMSNKAIARELHISIHTVKTHLRNIMDKLAVDSRLQVSKYVHETPARGQLPELDHLAKGATHFAGPAIESLMERTASRSGTDARGGHLRPGAGRRTTGSGGSSRHRSR